MTLAVYLAVLRRRAIVVVICIAAGVGGGFLQVHRTVKMYAATATYFVSLPSGTDNSSASQNAISVATSFLASFQELAEKRSTAEDVATALGVDPSLVVGHLSSSVETGTFYVDVTATSTDPNAARTLANAAAQTVTNLIPKIQGPTKDPAGASVTDQALVPTTPYQPTPKKTVGLGGLLGLLIGLALTAALETLDRSTRTATQASSLAGSPLLGVVPKHKNHSVRVAVPDAVREPYRSLRASVNFLNPDEPPVTIMITSPLPGDGKTTTALNLATVMAEAGSEVLLVDADLRRGQLTQLFSLRRAPGFTTVITRGAALEDVVLSQGPLFLLSSGPTAPNPSELLGSQSAVDVLALVRSRFDVVIIDAPPVLAVSDALALAPHVDAVIMVARHGKTSRSSLAEARRQLAAAGAAPSGLVYNAIPKREAADFYGQYAYIQD